MRLLGTPLVLSILTTLLTLPLFTTAKSTTTSFCKCICFNNSTIIALNPPTTTTARPVAAPTHTSPSIRNLLFRRSATAAAAKEDDSSSSPSQPATPAAAATHHKLSCSDCTRAFCLDYNLPICKNAKEEDVFTSCFQRDSLKDESVVVIFIFATAGLLAWAVVKPWIERLRERNERSAFAPLIGGHGGSSGPATANPNNASRDRGSRTFHDVQDDDDDGDGEHGRRQGQGLALGSRAGAGSASRTR